MSAIKIVPSERWDCGLLATRLREADLRELAASSGRTPYVALMRGLAMSDKCWTVLVDGEPEAMFGVGKFDEGVGCAWLVGSSWLDSPAARRPLLRYSREYVEKMHELYPVLCNYVDARNRRSIRWLQWLGFEHLYTEPEYGLARIPFLLMAKVRVRTHHDARALDRGDDR